ncbi:MAG: hypothetical protein PUJ55_10375 [Clostridiales bacterium]|nr:hypothetical protein [Roseburia sp.]MDD7637335.1 hypothetical protein [Clostridiales bacterium]
MERKDYQLLADIYYRGKTNISKEPVKAGVLGVIALLIFFVGAWAFQDVEGTWKFACYIYYAIQVVMSLIVSLRLMFVKKEKLTAMDAAVYMWANAMGASMTITWIFIRGLLDDSEVLAITFLIFLGVICIGFWITTARRMQKKLQAGGYRTQNYKPIKQWQVWIWGLAALPFAPLMRILGRRVWFPTLEVEVQRLIFMYMILWGWLLLIYTVFVPTALFIRLEKRMEREDDDKEKDAGNE